jgi:hypothetical protein
MLRPTFIFLKGGVKVDQVRGANKSYVILYYFVVDLPFAHSISSGIEQALIKHSSGSAPSAFSGKGNTLGGSSSASAASVVENTIPSVSNLDPQVKTLLLLVGAYLIFWYISS